MTLFFSEVAGALVEYQTCRRQDQPLGLEYEKIRLALRDAEAALGVNSRGKYSPMP